MNAATNIARTASALTNALEEYIIDTAADHELDFSIVRDATLRVVARALLPGDCSENDLLRAAWEDSCPDPFTQRVGDACLDIIDGVFEDDGSRYVRATA